MKTAGVNVFMDAMSGCLPKLQKHVKLNKASVKMNNIARRMEKEQKFPDSGTYKDTLSAEESTKDKLVLYRKYFDTPNAFYTRMEIFGKDDKIFTRTQRLKYDPDKCKAIDNETIGTPIVRVKSEIYNGNHINYDSIL